MKNIDTLEGSQIPPSLTFLKQDEYRQAACRCQTRTAQHHKCKSGAGGASGLLLKSKQPHILPVLLKRLTLNLKFVLFQSKEEELQTIVLIW